MKRNGSDRIHIISPFCLSHCKQENPRADYTSGSGGKQGKPLPARQDSPNQKSGDAASLRNRIADRTAPRLRNQIQTAVEKEEQRQNLNHRQQQNRTQSPARRRFFPPERHTRAEQGNRSELNQARPQLAPHRGRRPVRRQIRKTQPESGNSKCGECRQKPASGV